MSYTSGYQNVFGLITSSLIHTIHSSHVLDIVVDSFDGGDDDVGASSYKASNYRSF